MTRNTHSISNRNFCCFSYMIPMVHQNSPTVEFWHEKIEGNLRRANPEPSVDFRRANTEPSVDFRKANAEPSVHFRRANTETFFTQIYILFLRVGKDGVFLGLAGLLLGISLGLRPWEIPPSSPACPRKTPSFPPLLLRLTHSVMCSSAIVDYSVFTRKYVSHPLSPGTYTRWRLHRAV